MSSNPIKKKVRYKYKSGPSSMKLMPNLKKTTRQSADWGGFLLDHEGKKHYVHLWKHTLRNGKPMLVGFFRPADESEEARKKYKQKKLTDRSNIDELYF